MNRRAFLSSLAATGAAIATAPLSAIVPAAKPPRISTPSVSPLIEIEAADIRVGTSKDGFQNELIAVTESGETFTFSVGQMGGRTKIQRIMRGRAIDVEGFCLQVQVHHRDICEQVSRDQICRIDPPSIRAHLEWREISYT